MINIQEYLHEKTDDELREYFKELSVLEKEGALPLESKVHELVVFCEKEISNSYNIGWVMKDIYYEMAVRFYNHP